MMSFNDSWQKFYPSVPPLSFVMREAGIRHWVRFHYLPDTKRYAESAEERRSVLERLATLGNVMFRDQEECWIVRCESGAFGELKRWATASAKYIALHPCKPETRIEQFQGEDAEEWWTIYATKCSWHFPAFESLLRAIADDLADGQHWTLWLSVQSGRVYAPYDGGIDIFSPSEEWLNDLKRQHAGWLSPEPSGL